MKTNTSLPPAIRSMNLLAAGLLISLVAFLSGFSFLSWQAEKAYVLNEQANVLEFTSQFIDGTFRRFENGLLRQGLEITEGVDLADGRNVARAIYLLKGFKIRNRDVLDIALETVDGKILASSNMRLPPEVGDSPVAQLQKAARPDQSPRENQQYSSSDIACNDLGCSPGMLTRFWSADVREKHQLIVEPAPDGSVSDPLAVILRLHLQEKAGDPRYDMFALVRWELLLNYWKTADILKASHFGLMSDDARQVNLYPVPLRSSGENDGKHAVDLIEHLRATGFPALGQMEIRHDTEGMKRPVTFRRLENYPYTAFLSFPVSTIWNRWWERVSVLFYLSFIVLVTGAVLYRMALKSQLVNEQKRRRMQEKLRISDERWKLALECAGEGIWEIDYRSNEIQFSGLPLDLMSDGQKMTFDEWWKLICPEDLPHVKDTVEKFASGSTPTFRVEHRALCKDGQWKWLLARGKALNGDAEGKPVQILGTLIDISVQKNSLRQFEESEKRLREGFSLLPTGMAVLSKNGVVIEANPTLCQMFGYGEGEMQGMSFEQFFSGRERADSQLLRIVFSHDVQLNNTTFLERTAVHKSGQHFPVVYKLSMNQDAGETSPFVAQLEDLSERKRLQLKSMAKEILEAQERTTAQLSRELHDEVGQDLTALRLHLKLAQQSSDDRKTEVYLHDGQSMLDDLGKKIRNISNRIRPVAIDQLGLVPALRLHLSKAVRPFGQHVTLFENFGERRLPASLELCCFRVIQEALTNCLRHAKATIIEVSLRLEPNQLAISVRDNGVGFDISQYHASNESARSLGIVGMHERIAANGGELQIRSAPGTGTEIVAVFDISGELNHGH